MYINLGNKQIITHQAYNHPSKFYQNHIILKKQSTSHSINTCDNKAPLINNFAWKNTYKIKFYQSLYKMNYCMALNNL